MKHKVGIIIPVYNAEKYLPGCINSILGQRYENFRLILVNDGSKDCSGKICDSFKEQDKRITVVHKENGGANSARAVGVKYATDCDYITFVDSDDKLYDYSIEELVSCIDENIDIIIGKVNDDAIVSDCEKTIDAEDYRRQLICQNISWSPCAKLYKKALFNEKVFSIPDSIKLGEDYLMNLRLSFNSANKIYLLPKCIYQYNRNLNSVTFTTTNSVHLRDNLYKIIMTIIPEDKQGTYINELIKLRLNFLNEYVISFDNAKYQSTHIYVSLIEDIEKVSYPIEYLYKKILTTKSNITRKMLLVLYKIRIKAKKISFKFRK